MKKKIFFILFVLITLFSFSTTNLIAQSCLSGGVNGTCTSQAACDPSTSTYSTSYLPVNICLSKGGCCTTNPTPKPTPQAMCYLATGSTNACGNKYGGPWNHTDVVCKVGGVVWGKTYCCKTDADCTAIQSVDPNSITGQQNPTCGNGNIIGTEIDTAIGCIPFQNMGTFVGTILGWAVGIGGGIAFLLILSAGFSIMTSAGNPDRLKNGQELLVSAISGLILLIFSIFILKLIGINILGLGAFGFGGP